MTSLVESALIYLSFWQRQILTPIQRVGGSQRKFTKACPETVLEILKRESDVIVDAEVDFEIIF